jgi:putative isomerase
LFLAALVIVGSFPAYAQTRSRQYQEVQKRLATGWNTWDVHSVATNVLLPDGLAIRISIHRRTTLNAEAILTDPLIGRLAADAEQVFPGPHAWDGSYTDLRVVWRGLDVRIQSAHAGSDLVVLVTRLNDLKPTNLSPTAILSVAYLWNKPGTVASVDGHVEARGPLGVVNVFCSAPAAPLSSVAVPGPYLAAEITTPVGISTGKPRTIGEIEQAVDQQRRAYEKSLGAAHAGTIDAIQSTLGWDTIYEPEHDRVISPVSRLWSVDWGGYVLFDWDTFFAATLAAIGRRDLAYANAIEILREETPSGFVPNYARAGGWKSNDRSEPPVGAITVLGLYEKFHDRWFLEETFTPLLSWNRWWHSNRCIDSYLVFGSDPHNAPENLDDDSRGTRQGAIFESGLDNSPMYDDAEFDNQTHRLLIADVGLMSLYVADCQALAKIAALLKHPELEKELGDRAAFYRASLATLWDERSGIFLNKDLRTGRLSLRTSPTNFYVLLAHAASPEQADRMIREHLTNPNEFWGEWVIPSTPRNDPAFKDQNYWRGRIWGPMNYLVYLGLCNYDQPQVRAEFAQKSMALFEKEWKSNHHVHENYNAVSGSGDDVTSSDRFYHWGALLAFIQYEESNRQSAGQKQSK